MKLIVGSALFVRDYNGYVVLVTAWFFPALDVSGFCPKKASAEINVNRQIKKTVREISFWTQCDEGEFLTE